MTDHPDLASAARELASALDTMMHRGTVLSPNAGLSLKAVRAALSAHDQQGEPDVDELLCTCDLPNYAGKCSVHNEEPAPAAHDTPPPGCGPECSEHHTFEPPCELWIDSAGGINYTTPRRDPADLPADTPEPPEEVTP